MVRMRMTVLRAEKRSSQMNQELKAAWPLGMQTL